MNKCDCHNDCGDDPQIYAGNAEPCDHLLARRANEMRRKSWTIEELKLAEELCFPLNFRLLWAEITGDGEAMLYTHRVRQVGLIGWIFNHSRADFEAGDTKLHINTLITRLLGDAR